MTAAPTPTSTPTATATPIPTSGSAAVPGAGRTFTPADDGATVTLRAGETGELVVPDPTAPDPRLSGGAVELVEVVNVTASGRREWEIRAVAPGRAVISGDVPSPWTLTFVVS